MDVRIIYGSTTGNTEETAHMIEDALSGDCAVTVKSAADDDALDMNHVDLLIFGVSTWGNGDIQEDMQAVYEKLDIQHVKGRNVAVFGLGDSAFPLFGKAADLISEKVQELGGNLVADVLKVDGTPDESEEEIEEWAKNLV